MEDLGDNNQTNVDIVDGKSNSDEDAKLIYARMKGRNFLSYADLCVITHLYPQFHPAFYV